MYLHLVRGLRLIDLHLWADCSDICSMEVWYYWQHHNMSGGVECYRCAGHIRCAVKVSELCCDGRPGLGLGVCTAGVARC